MAIECSCRTRESLGKSREFYDLALKIMKEKILLYLQDQKSLKITVDEIATDLEAPVMEVLPGLNQLVKMKLVSFDFVGGKFYYSLTLAGAIVERV